MDVLDKELVPMLQLPKAMKSIYHLANMFGYPLSFFLEDTVQNCNRYYAQWREQYKTYQKRLDDGTLVEEVFMPTLSEQEQVLRQSYSVYYEGIAQLQKDLIGLQKGKTPQIIKSAEDVLTGESESSSKRLSGNIVELEKSSSHYIKRGAIDLANKFLRTFLKNIARDPIVKNLNAHLMILATTILTVLVTKKANPAEAMGYGGFDNDIAEQLASKYHKVAQGAILAEHSAMMVPSHKMMQEVYIKELFSGEPQAFQFFGKWPC